jgi:hypothetical protein
MTGLDATPTKELPQKKNKHDSAIKAFEGLFHCFHIDSF